MKKMIGMRYSYYKKKVHYARLLFLTFVGVLFAFSAFTKQPTQSENNYIIYGKVVNKKNQPIAYANIGIVNKLVGTVSNIEGEFKLVLKKELFKDSLTFSCIGYKSKSFKISTLTGTNRDELVIQLEEEVEELEEVVVRSENFVQKEQVEKRNQATFRLLFIQDQKTWKIKLEQSSD